MKPHYLLIALTICAFTITTTKPWLVIAQPVQLAQNDTEQIERKTAAQSIAAQVTVGIRIGQGSGSGVLIAKKGNTYLVMTNAHVVRDPGSITLQTPDKQSYTARLVQNTQVGNFDVALLEFTSTRAYQLVKFDNFGNSTATLNEGREVFAAGFPFDSNALKFVIGEVKQLPQEPFANGTQIGYVTKGDIEQGMSGGPILDSLGNLVGINSTLAHPIKPSYTYADGSKAPQDRAAEYRQANWGVPMYNLLTRLNPDILYSYKQLPKLHRTVTPSGYMAELDRKARQVTVRIENADGNGSGTIVAQDGNNYSVLTAEHVVKNTTQLRITTHDQRTYTISPSQINRSEGTDLAVIKFTSSQPYQTATLGNYSVLDGDVVFPGGWPAPQKIKSQQWQWQLNPGGISSKEQGEFRTQDKLSFSNGYDLIYSSVTYGGMSGGPVFDSAGRVIGIHGKAEGNGNTGNILGSSLGISIKTFVGLADRLKVNQRSLQIATTPPELLDSAKVASVSLMMNNIATPTKDSDAKQWIEYGNQLHRLGKYADAVKAFDRSISLKSDSLDAHYGKGLALGANSNNIAALGSFDRAIQLVPPGSQSSYYYLWKYRSLCLKELKRYAEALVAISRASDLDPQDIMILNEKALLFSELKRYPEAIAILDKIIAKKPKTWAYSNRGNFKSALGDKKGALADYDRAIRVNPRYAIAYFNRGFTKSALGDRKGAIADYDSAVRINPQYSEAYYNRGLTKSELGDRKGAIADYDSAVRINPQYSEAYYNRGLAKAELGDKKGELADYNSAILINPQDAEAYYNRGLAKAELGDTKNAIMDYDNAIRINSQYADAYYNRGVVKSDLDDKKGALADYNNAIRINPQYAKSYYNRGVVKSDLGDKKGALADYDSAIRINSQYAKAYGNRGVIKSDLGDKKGALADYDNAIHINSQYVEAYYNRGLAKADLGDKKGALADLKIASQLSKAQNNMAAYEKVIALIQQLNN